MSDLTFFEISIYHKIALYRLRLLKYLWENQGQVIYGIPWVPDGETKVKSKRCVVFPGGYSHCGLTGGSSQG